MSLNLCIAKLATALNVQLTGDRIAVYQEALARLANDKVWEDATRDLLASCTRFPTIPEMRVAYRAASDRQPALTQAEPARNDPELNAKLMRELAQHLGNVGREM